MENLQVEEYQSIKDTIDPYLFRIDGNSIILRMTSERAEQIDFNHPTFKQFFDGWSWQFDENGCFTPAEIISEWVLITLNFNAQMRQALKFLYPSFSFSD